MSDNYFDQYNTYGAEPPLNPERAQPEQAQPEQVQPEQVQSTPYTGSDIYSSSRTYEPASSDPTPADRVFTNPYTSYTAPQQSAYHVPNSTPGADGYYHHSYVPRQPEQKKKPERAKVSKGTVALILIVCIIVSGFAGYGGSMLANRQNTIDESSSTDSMVVHKVEATTAVADGSTVVDKTTAEITSEVADAVVEITTEVMQTSTFYGQYIATGAGSGVIIDSNGYIITNNHVIDGASSITVTLRTGDSYDATLVGTDSEVDIALLKIEATGLTAAVFGDSDTLSVGDKTVIIGNPLGTLGGSVTEGIVSALDRSIVIDDTTMTLLQTDAAINPGNSGGGMFNGQGELVGIVVAKSSSSSSEATIDNIGFVIPINNVLDILSDLKEYGYVRGRAATGMTFVDLSNEMYSMYYYGNSTPGVYIYSVERSSNAYEAGFRAGDRVVSIDGEQVSSTSDISTIISKHSAGDSVTFELERQSSTGSISLELEEDVPQSDAVTDDDSFSSPFSRGFGF